MIHMLICALASILMCSNTILHTAESCEEFEDTCYILALSNGNCFSNDNCAGTNLPCLRFCRTCQSAGMYILTLKRQVNVAADSNLFLERKGPYIFFYVGYSYSPDISCESTAWQPILMKC